MRRPSNIPRADRSREDTTTESHYWDEGLQPHHPDPPASNDPHSEQAPIHDNEHHLDQPLIGSPHDVAVDTLMADAFPTNNVAPVASSTTATTNSAASSFISSPSQDSDEIRNHHEISVDASSPFYDSSHPDYTPSASISLSPPNLESHYDPEDHDQDMSDNETGNEVLSDQSWAIGQGWAIDQSLTEPEVDAQEAFSLGGPPADSSYEDEDEDEDFGEIVQHPPMDTDFSGFGEPADNDEDDDDSSPSGPFPEPFFAIPWTGLGDLPALISNPNPIMLGGDNLGFQAFLRDWAVSAYRSSRSSENSSPSAGLFYPGLRKEESRVIKEVRYSDLEGDFCDMQGVDWAAMRTTRRTARLLRSRNYKNYTNKAGSDVWMPVLPDVYIAPSDSFFRFKRLLVRKDTRLAHFQLRSVLACPSRTQAFYPGLQCINRINLDSKATDTFVNMRTVHGLGSVVSALDANHGVLMAGMFNGEYCLKQLDSEGSGLYADGRITTNPTGITNHLQIYLHRQSSQPVAALSSNDNGFRIMDLTTEKVISETTMPYSMNCSAISPDSRLRVMVGDAFNVVITDADTGKIQQELSGHRDYGFSCDWSDDGWTVATGYQDKSIKIWDARKWRDSRGKSAPVTTIRSEMASVRNLRFSPGGSGMRVLVAAEEADFVHVIDAQTFKSKQTFDIFGEIGGVAFTNEGQNLNVLCTDSFRGGLLQFERCGLATEPFVRQIDGGDGFENQRDPYEPMDRRPAMLDPVPLF